jgi:GNAT superfamily N-acetyltransferase
MSDASVTIRRAVLRDVEALVPLFDSYRQFYGQSSNPELARKFLTERLERGESTVFIAEDGRRAVGFAQSFPMFSSVSAARIYVLNDLFVAPEARRRGVGQALLAASLEFARSVGAVRVTLSDECHQRPSASPVRKNRLGEGHGLLRLRAPPMSGDQRPSCCGPGGAQ